MKLRFARRWWERKRDDDFQCSSCNDLHWKQWNLTFRVGRIFQKCPQQTKKRWPSRTKRNIFRLVKHNFRFRFLKRRKKNTKTKPKMTVNLDCNHSENDFDRSALTGKTWRKNKGNISRTGPGFLFKIVPPPLSHLFVVLLLFSYFFFLKNKQKNKGATTTNK